MGAATVHEFKDKKSFNNFVDSNKYVVISFTSKKISQSTWINPTFSKLSEEHPEIKFVQLDVDEMSGMAQDYGVSEIPRVLCLRNLEPNYESDCANIGDLTHCIKTFSELVKAPEAKHINNYT
ncbi:hypothetical protein IWW56_002086 [Coemansia sp. RSA 2131]|nr:hypothetical protein IWW56_002086 [Coemansia sp. RSA 2131]